MKEVTAAIIRFGEKYLICQRAADDECGMQWEFPGGKLEAGETLEECIVREIREELELDIKVLGVFTKSIYHFSSKEIYFTVFNAEITGGDLKLNVHNDVKWVTLQEMAGYEFMPADVEFVKKLAAGSSRLIDLSQPIEDKMPVYPGDKGTILFQSEFLSKDKYNNHSLETGMHAGTHIDSPMHLTDSGKYINEYELEAFVGHGCILDVRNQPVITMKEEYRELVKENSIVLLYTGYDKLYGAKEYYQEHPVIDIGLCRFLIQKNIRMLGVDMPSPDRYPFEIHKLLFEKNIFIIENLTNLDKLPAAGDFEVIALPLKIRADSSIARVAARLP